MRKSKGRGEPGDFLRHQQNDFVATEFSDRTPGCAHLIRNLPDPGKQRFPGWSVKNAMHIVIFGSESDCVIGRLDNGYQRSDERKPPNGGALFKQGGQHPLYPLSELTLRTLRGMAPLLQAKYSIYPGGFRVFGIVVTGIAAILFLVPQKGTPPLRSLVGSTWGVLCKIRLALFSGIWLLPDLRGHLTVVM